MRRHPDADPEAIVEMATPARGVRIVTGSLEMAGLPE
jgi:hypothetical protein